MAMISAKIETTTKNPIATFRMDVMNRYLRPKKRTSFKQFFVKCCMIIIIIIVMLIIILIIIKYYCDYSGRIGSEALM